MPGGYGMHEDSAASGLVRAVESGSPAEQAGIRAGDVVVAVDGEAVADAIDWQFKTAEPAFEVALTRGGTPMTTVVERGSGALLGVEFESLLFDEVRTCRNDCLFCFMSQLPRGLRPALYLRDDDFRLSFAQGNFITLTNLAAEDAERIIEQHLSPLYVSLHAVSESVRGRLVCAREDRALGRVDTLLAAGIELHVQIVLVPDINDGPELERTLEWLFERRGVLSVGIVPVGYTRHQTRITCSYEEPGAALQVLEALAPWQVRARARDGHTWVYAADELYLNSGMEIPPEEYYDGFPQYENGIGPVRVFSDAFAETATTGALSCISPSERIRLVTGTSFEPALSRLLAKALPDHAEVSVLAVTNRFFGGNVSVAGLLTAEDIAAAIRDDSAPSSTVYAIPDCILNADGVTLDDVTFDELAARVRRRVRLVSCDAAGLVDALVGRTDSPDKGR